MAQAWQPWTDGQLLQIAALAAQASADSKDFVDMPITSGASAEDVRIALDGLQNDSEAARNFLNDYFDPPGSDLEPCSPPDFMGQPNDFLPAITSPPVQEWALALHAMWPQLCRQVKACVLEAPEHHSLLPLPHPFFIPGQRFRELYYWDSYWVVKGLLISRMPDSAKGVVRNLLALVKEHGHVPNGSRSYYLNRSQPPLLSMMVGAVYEATQDLGFLREAFAALETEYSYWTRPPKAVRIAALDGSVHSLARYSADTDSPRPESFREDVATAAGCADASAAAALYRELASAAESGWDFSSRWMADPDDLASIRTTRIVPADLNAFLCRMEADLHCFAQVLGDADKADRHHQAHLARRQAIKTLMLDMAYACWRDLLLDEEPEEPNGAAVTASRICTPGHYHAANFIPLWLDLSPDENASLCVLQSLQAVGLIQAAGIATSTQETGQQWDGSNAWPPIQAMLIEAAASHGGEAGRRLAAKLAQAWLESNLLGWQQHGQMFEKYNAAKPGRPGGQGEYPVQAGFGWTNGTALMLLERFGWQPAVP